jgi:hypothetical protein
MGRRRNELFGAFYNVYFYAQCNSALLSVREHPHARIYLQSRRSPSIILSTRTRLLDARSYIVCDTTTAFIFYVYPRSIMRGKTEYNRPVGR